MKLLKSILRTLLYIAVMCAFTVLLIVISGANLSDALSKFANGIWGTKLNIGEVFVKATPLMLTGTACALAFRTGFFNIGAEGQFYIGAVAAAAAALRLPLPGMLRLAVAFIAGFLAGGIWALIAAGMKLRFKSSEIIVTIMLNYISVNFLAMAVRTFLKDPKGTLPYSEKLDPALVLSKLVNGTRIHTGILVALACAFIVWFIIDKTSWGYQMRVVGFNPRAAQCSGISVSKSVIRASLLSGGIAGLAGVIEVLAIQKKLLEGFSSNCGYTGVLIALLASNKPQFVPVVAIIYAAISSGAATMERQTSVPSAMVNILIGSLVIGVLLKKYFDSRREGVLK